MEPIPETREAISQLSLQPADADLLEALTSIGRRVEEVVPDVVGMSVTLLDHGVTFTLVASDETIAVLDALQYLGGGPCVRAVDENITVAVDSSTMGEEGWQTFADATAAKGVASTLSMPIVLAGEIIGGVNLYGGSRRAFDDVHEQLAEIVGTWAGGAITNADLSFSTRSVARRAPDVLRAQRALDHAHGIIAVTFGFSIDDARERLRLAARRAGLEPVLVAEVLADLLERPTP